jgi:putative membrane protein
MMDWNDWSGGTWVWMTLMMVVFWGLAIAAGVYIVRALSSQRQTPDQGATTPQEILAERFARGEIDADEYERRRTTLQQNEPQR